MERVETTFYSDFTIAERFGEDAIKDTFKRAFEEWKTDYKYLTELVIVLNYKCWDWHDEGNVERSKLYAELFYKAQDWAYNNLKGEELNFFYEVTD